jgi:hypothetical protein
MTREGKMNTYKERLHPKRHGERRIAMRRFCGPLLIATGVLHLLVGLMFYVRPLTAIARDGFFNAVTPDLAAPAFDRDAAFWFMFFGVMILILGALMHWSQARIGSLPAFLGWALLSLGVAGVILMPLSGFWLVLPQAVLVLAVARRGRPRTDIAEAGPGVSTGNRGGLPS